MIIPDPCPDCDRDLDPDTGPGPDPNLILIPILILVLMLMHVLMQLLTRRGREIKYGNSLPLATTHSAGAECQTCQS